MNIIPKKKQDLPGEFKNIFSIFFTTKSESNTLNLTFLL